MKWIVSALILAAGLLGMSMEARASSTLLSYPWPVDPCETFDENQGCVPVDDPNQLYWTIFDREFDHEWY